MQINQYPSIGSSSLSSLIASTLARRSVSSVTSGSSYSSSLSSYTPSYSSGGINYASSAAISELTAKIDSLNSQVSAIKNKLVVSNSIKNSYSSR